jgi:hypothetical protein
MQHLSMAVNAAPRLNGDEAPWKLRFDEDFPGQLIPFGAKILFWNNPKRADNTSGKRPQLQMMAYFWDITFSLVLHGKVSIL